MTRRFSLSSISSLSSTALFVVALSACPPPPVADGTPTDDDDDDDDDTVDGDTVDGDATDATDATDSVDDDSDDSDASDADDVDTSDDDDDDEPIDAGLPEEDAGAADADAGTLDPIRTVATAPLFGGLPVDNLFLDAQSTLSSYAGWLFTLDSANPASTPAITRVHVVGTPLDQVALRVVDAQNAAPVISIASARGGAGPFAVTIWLGRADGAADAHLTEAAVALLATTDEGEVAYDLAYDESDTVVDAAGVSWLRFAAVVPDDIHGWAHLLVDDASSADLFMAAPVMTSSSTAPFAIGGPTAIPATARAARPTESVALARIAAELSRRMGERTTQAPSRRAPLTSLGGPRR